MVSPKSSMEVRADSLSDALIEARSTQLELIGAPTTFQNPITGQGTNKDRHTFTQAVEARLLDRSELDALYMHWLCRRVVDYVADEITRVGWMVQLGKDSNSEAIPGIDQAFRDLYAEEVVNEALKSARQNGGSAILMYVEDGRRPDQPINWNAIEGISGIESIDRWYLKPKVQFPIGRLSRPSMYELQIEDIDGGQQQDIHPDRILRIPGRRLPLRLQQLNDGWDLSELQLIFEAVARYTTGQSSVLQVLQDLDVFVHKIKGLAALLASGKKQTVIDRLEVNNIARSQYRGYAVDADKEEIGFQSRTCSGLGDILGSLRDELVGATGFPATILFGESPKGIGATGRSEERDFSRTIESYRDRTLRRSLMTLSRVILMSKSGPTNGKVPKEWYVNFPSLFVLNEREQADLRARVAAADYRYWVMGVVTSAEIAMSRFGGAEYSTDTNLDMTYREPDGTLNDDKIEELLRVQGKIDPEDQLEMQMKQAQARVSGPAGIRGLSKTGERSDPTDNEEGSMDIDGAKSISSGGAEDD